MKNTAHLQMIDFESPENLARIKRLKRILDFKGERFIDFLMRVAEDFLRANHHLGVHNLLSQGEVVELARSMELSFDITQLYRYRQRKFKEGVEYQVIEVNGEKRYFYLKEPITRFLKRLKKMRRGTLKRKKAQYRTKRRMELLALKEQEQTRPKRKYTKRADKQRIEAEIQLQKEQKETKQSKLHKIEPMRRLEY